EEIMIVDYRKEAPPEPSQEQVSKALGLFMDTFPIQSQVCMKSYWKAVKTIESVTFKGMQGRYLSILAIISGVISPV
ncbi:TPA: hypothetical protein ACPVYZ_004878, partial [Vibrio parahaemolyticus]